MQLSGCNNATVLLSKCARVSLNPQRVQLASALASGM